MDFFWHKLPEEYKQEMQGSLAGVQTSRSGPSIGLPDIVALNGYFDVVSYHYWLKSKEKSEAKASTQLVRTEHCSAFIPQETIRLVDKLCSATAHGFSSWRADGSTSYSTFYQLGVLGS